MIRIAITAGAHAALAATLPSSVGVEQQRANGDHHIWLEPRYVDRLRALRGPGESLQRRDLAASGTRSSGRLTVV